jgi:phosphoglycolate phosphatase
MDKGARMIARHRLVLFDCDGTLVDSQRPILRAMAAVFEEREMAPPSAADVRQVIGLVLPEAMARLLPNRTAAERETLVARYKAIYAALRTEPDHAEPLYPGALEAIEDLREGGFMLGVVTGKSERGLKATLALHGIEDRFATLQTGDRNPGKPDPSMVEKAMAEVGADRAGTLVVGDTTFDVLMARAAGVSALGVGWGYHSRLALIEAGALAVIDRFAELAPLARALGRDSSVTGGMVCA